MSLLNNFTTTAQTATATNLTFAVAANEIWEIEYFGTCQCSSTGGVKYQITAPVSATVQGWLQSSTSAILTLTYQRITAISTLTATAAHTVATTPGQDQIIARVKNGANAGSITIAANAVTSTQTTTIFAGAILTARKVTEV